MQQGQPHHLPGQQHQVQLLNLLEQLHVCQTHRDVHVCESHRYENTLR
jgi:hypothetical protein